MSDKLKILIATDWSLAKTGFGRAAKSLISYLYNTGKYEIVHYCCGMVDGNPELARTPWKSIGCLPNNQQKINELNKDPHAARQASYGSVRIDDVVKEERPDIFIAAQDIWGVDFYVNKPWFKEITSVIWTTLDSLPILPTAVEVAKKVDHFWVWSNFAEKEMHKMGLTHVKTVHGPLEDSHFHKLSKDVCAKLRYRFNLSDEFIVGYVFRNQLRKSVPNLIEGYAKFKAESRAKSKLLLHTNFAEGWDIFRLADQYGVDRDDILTTYVCNSCKNYAVFKFVGQEKDCPYCKKQKTLNTTSTSCGVTEAQLNEVYNLMDVYLHPITSGGQELPVQEAKFTELITLVTNYSCGEEMCEEEAYSLPLEWSKYTEHQTQFIKASTDPRSIRKQLMKVYNMKPEKREEWGKKAREWTLNGYSTKNVGGQIENFLDSRQKVSYNFNFEFKEKNPHAIIPYIEDDREWLKVLYKEILGMNVSNDDEGLNYWLKQLNEV